MSNEPPREDTTRIIRRMADGQAEAFNDLWDCYDKKMVEEAAVMIRRLRIDEAVLDAEGAANYTLFEICRSANRGKLDAIRNSDQFWGYFARILERVILDQSDRQKARKRGGPGIPPARAGQEIMSQPRPVRRPRG